MSGLGNSFDKDTSTNVLLEMEDSEDLKSKLDVLQDYNKKRTFLNIIGNGSKGKFDLYAVDLFIFGKSNSKWMDNVLTEETFSTGQTRLLAV